MEVEVAVVEVVLVVVWEAEAWEAEDTEDTEDMADTAVSLEVAMIGVLPQSKPGTMLPFKCARQMMTAHPAVAHHGVSACKELPAHFPNPN